MTNLAVLIPFVDAVFGAGDVLIITATVSSLIFGSVISAVIQGRKDRTSLLEASPKRDENVALKLATGESVIGKTQSVANK